jgi:hypothetical protein
VIRLHLVPFFGAMDVREIREEHLLEYVQTKLAAKRPSEKEGSQPRSLLKPATIRLHLAILRRVLGLLEREGKIPKNPARGIGELLRRVGRSLASETEEVEHWTRGEARALIRLAREHEPRFAPLLGHADPALTLRVYAHAMRAEEGDLSFADFAGRSQPADDPGRPYTAPTDSTIPGEGEDPERSSGGNARDSEDFPADWMVAQARIELATPAFSVRCSTN